MVDHVSREGRTRIMSAIRSVHTKPELSVRRFLHSQGYRFRLHHADLPGKPDIVFPSRKKVIFVHGCFWHQHQSSKCTASQKPSSNQDYWLPKLQRNQERDVKVRLELEKLGWKSFVIWECEIDKQDLKQRLHEFLRKET